MQPYSSRLPQEIVDQICDHIRDKRTLRACTLVSHAWSSRSYTRLWEFVYIMDRNVLPDSTFCNLLRASLRLRFTITTMEVVASTYVETQGYSESFITLLDLLPNLHTLRLSDISLNVVGRKYMQWNRQTPLRELALNDYGPHRHADVIALLTFFAKVPVERLAVNRISLSSGAEESAPLTPEDAKPFLDWKVGELMYNFALVG